MAIESFTKALQKVWDGFRYTNITPQLEAERSDPFTHNPTGHNVVKPVHVSVAVQSNAMRCYVPATVNPCTQKQKKQEIGMMA